MTTYRTTGAWGAGKGSDLTPVEVDTNFWDIIERIVTIEELPDPSAGIESFSVIGTDFYVQMTDATQLGPYPLPLVKFTARGAWTPSTPYVVMDTFDNGGALYMVLVNHTSALTFDAGANDGLGNEYYGLMLSTPSTVLPTGGSTGMALQKASGADFDTTWDFVLPDSGATGQALVKVSGTSQDVDWQTVAAENVSFVPTLPMTSTNVQDALDEVAGTVVGAAEDITFDPASAPSLISTNVQDALVELDTNMAAIPAVTGKKTIWVPANLITPRTTNGPSAGLVEMATNKNMVKTLDFDTTTEEYAQFDLILPKSWGGSNIDVLPVWSHGTAITSFGVVWRIDAAEVIDGGALDTAFGVGSAMATIISTGGTANDLVIPVAGTFFPGSTSGALRQIRVYRVPSHGSDTLLVDARLHGVVVYYYTTAATDD